MPIPAQGLPARLVKFQVLRKPFLRILSWGTSFQNRACDVRCGNRLYQDFSMCRKRQSLGAWATLWLLQLESFEISKNEKCSQFAFLMSTTRLEMKLWKPRLSWTENLCELSGAHVRVILGHEDTLKTQRIKGIHVASGNRFNKFYAPSCQHQYSHLLTSRSLCERFCSLVNAKKIGVSGYEQDSVRSSVLKKTVWRTTWTRFVTVGRRVVF